MNISVLRNVFDRTCGQSTTDGLHCPKPAAFIPKMSEFK